MINFMSKNHYTYAYLREDRTPYYIGRGSGRRVFKNHRHIPVPPKDRIIMLKTGLSFAESVRHEVYMIFVFGRKDNGSGILRNLTDGGEGTPGRSPSEQTREKIRATLETTHATRGTNWWRNPSENREIQSFESPGPGWERGRLKFSTDTLERMKLEGEKHGRSRLTNDDRRQIALEYIPGKKNGHNGNCSELATRYGVGMSQIRRIARNPRWTS
jgi:hypothetical protein